MERKVVELAGKLSPDLDYGYHRLRLASFELMIDGGSFRAIPAFEMAPADQDRLRDEMEPILNVLSVRAKVTVSAYVSNVSTTKGAILQGPPSAPFEVYEDPDLPEAEIRRDFSGVLADPIYSDLVTLLAQAQKEPNPRPSVFKMIERLEVRFRPADGRNARREALAQLGMRIQDVHIVVREQSKYIGDRHACNDVDYALQEIPWSERERVLELARDIVRRYGAFLER